MAEILPLRTMRTMAEGEIRSLIDFVAVHNRKKHVGRLGSFSKNKFYSIAAKCSPSSMLKYPAGKNTKEQQHEVKFNSRHH